MDKFVGMYTRMVIVLLIISASEGILGANKLSRQKRVIGGTEVLKGDHPWLVSLHGKIVTARLFGYIPIRHMHVYCGGSLLNDRYILTAAHCFDFGREGRNVKAWDVRLATVDLKIAMADRFMDFLGKTLGKKDWRTWEINVAKIVIHPGYYKDDLWYQDIALVQLVDRVPSGSRFEHIKRINLPEFFDFGFPAIGTKCHMTGWGCTSAGGSLSRYAMSVELPIIRNDVCDFYYSPRSMFGRLCAGFKSDMENGGICPGDSGGPLVCQNTRGDWVQVGVASFTSKMSPERFPAVFTRVSDYVTWIKGYIDY